MLKHKCVMAVFMHLAICSKNPRCSTSKLNHQHVKLIPAAHRENIAVYKNSVHDHIIII